MIMSEKFASFPRKPDCSSSMTTPNISQEARTLSKAVIKESDVNDDTMMTERRGTVEGCHDEGSVHRSFSRTDLIESDDELVEVDSPERAEESDDEEERGSSRPLDFTTNRRLSEESSEGEDEYPRSVNVRSS